MAYRRIAMLLVLFGLLSGCAQQATPAAQRMVPTVGPGVETTQPTRQPPTHKPAATKAAQKPTPKPSPTPVPKKLEFEGWGSKTFPAPRIDMVAWRYTVTCTQPFQHHKLFLGSAYAKFYLIDEERGYEDSSRYVHGGFDRLTGNITINAGRDYHWELTLEGK